MVVSSPVLDGLWMTCGPRSAMHQTIWVAWTFDDGNLWYSRILNGTGGGACTLGRAKIEASKHNADRAWITWIEAGTFTVSYTLDCWASEIAVNLAPLDIGSGD